MKKYILLLYNKFTLKPNSFKVNLYNRNQISCLFIEPFKVDLLYHYNIKILNHKF